MTKKDREILNLRVGLSILEEVSRGIKREKQKIVCKGKEKKEMKRKYNIKDENDFLSLKKVLKIYIQKITMNEEILEREIIFYKLNTFKTNKKYSTGK